MARTGVDFSSLELRYVADTGGSDMSYAFRALPSAERGDPRVGLDMAEEASDAFFVWLALPPSAFIVSLNPSQPDLIVDSEFGRTDAGRILLEADLRMKKTTAALIHPDTDLGRQYWDSLAWSGDDLCVASRMWIVPAEAVVHEDAGELYILEAPLDVRTEAQHLEIDGSAACPGQPPEVVAQNVEALRP